MGSYDNMAAAGQGPAAPPFLDDRDAASGRRTEGASPALEALSPAQRRLLALRVQRQHGVQSAIRPRTEGVNGPASPSQEALLVLDRLTGPSAIYNSPFCYRLRGPIDVTPLERSLQDLIRRHAALRTRFVEIDGQFEQHLEATIHVALRPIDLLATTPDQQSALDQKLADFATRPFDLQRGPLYRFALYRIGPDDHVLAMVIHHIISDGWSRGVLVRDLSATYTNEIAGRAHIVASSPIDFIDYTRWQRDRLQGATLDALTAYWRGALAGLEPLPLPTDRPRPAHSSHRGDVETFVVPAPLVNALKAIALERQATLFIVLLAAFKVFLLRVTGQFDIAVGSPVARRDRPELEQLVGYFINTLVMRTDLSGEPSFLMLVDRVRKTVLDALAHQELPSDRLVAELGRRSDRSVNPLYQVGFVLQNLPEAALAISGVTVTPVPVPTRTAKSDLWLALTEIDGTLRGELTYSSDLYDATTIQRFARHLITLLEGIAIAPTQIISRIPLLDAVERHRILYEWNDTARSYAFERSVTAMIEAQVCRTPHARAVQLEDQVLTYAQINRRANQLAHRLRALGVGPDVLVGVCMERSFELVIALLGVLKAGGAYLPIDPDFPAERVRFVVSDSEAPIVLTQEACLAVLKRAGVDARTVVLSLDTGWSTLASESASDPTQQGTPDDLAYVIYTSGSTGRPKGALIPHRGLTNHVLWLLEQFHFTAADRVLQKTSISFDASVWEFVVPLAAGGCLVLARPGGQADARYLVQTLIEQRITILQLVPSLLRALVMDPDFASCTALRYVVSGGESLDAELARQFLGRVPAATLGNYYGASEASDDTTYFELRTPPEGAASIPIGRPMANAQCHILDAQLEPVPAGVIGELFIGGAGLGRGYWRRPELTAERFIGNPFRPGERLYRTGDLARYRPGGEIEYVGRADSQIKLRGFRIELGEIETVLRQYAGVTASVVIVHGDSPTVRRLIAYVVGPSLDVDAIGAFVRERLPVYMIPGAVIALETFPLLPNGKLDRRALPIPDTGVQPHAFVAPGTPTEEAVCAIWQEVLGIASVSVEDDFFDQGGHSLTAMQIVARIRSRFGFELPLRSLLDAASVRSVALAIDRAAVPEHFEQLEQSERSEPDALEAALAGIWAGTFALERIDPHATIAQLNGDSAIEEMLLAAVNAVFEVELSIDDLRGERGTIRGMARLIASRRATSPSVHDLAADDIGLHSSSP